MEALCIMEAVTLANWWVVLHSKSMCQCYLKRPCVLSTVLEIPEWTKSAECCEHVAVFEVNLAVVTAHTSAQTHFLQLEPERRLVRINKNGRVVLC